MAAITTLSQITRGQAPMARLRPITRRPSTAMLRPQRTPGRTRLGVAPSAPKKEDRGVLGNIWQGVKQVGSFPYTIALASPQIVGKLAQTVGGAGEELFNIATDVVDRDLYTSRFDTQLARADALGLKGADRAEYAMQTAFPLIGSVVGSMGRSTIPTIGELATAGQADFGQPGSELAREFRAGNIGNKLLEDVGNVLLMGRLTGAGSVATTGGRALAAAGRPRLGAAVRRAGYFAEQPIAATTRGVARLGQKGFGARPVASRTGVLGARLTEGGRRISGSQTPLLETLNVARAGVDIRTQNQINEALRTENALKQEQVQAEAQGELFPEEKVAQLRKATNTVETLQKRTTAGRRLRSFSQRAIREGESLKRGFTQPFTRFSALGAVPDAVDSLQRQLEAEQGRVARGETERQPFVDHLNRKLQAKQLDPNNERLNTEEMKNDSFAAAALVGTQLIDIIKNEADKGVPVTEIIARITPEELPEFIRRQGYDITPSAIQRALDYIEGRLDAPDRVLDRVSVDEALILLSSFDEFMEYRRRTGEGMVRGAGDPFERGQFPIPRYVLSALDQYTTVGPYIENILNIRVAQLLLNEYPQLLDELGIDPNSLDNPQGLFRLFAETPAQPELYKIAYEAIQLALPDLYGTFKFRDFINDPLIFPAPMRIKVKAQQGVIQAMRGEDVTRLADDLTRFAEEFPDVLPQKLADKIGTLVDVANDPQKRLDKDNWVKARSLVKQIERSIKSAQDKITRERGRLNAQMDARWARLDQLTTSVQSALGMIQTIIDQPELFADQAQLAEVGRLRGAAEEAQAGASQIDLFLEARKRTRGPVEGPQGIRVIPEIVRDSERLNAELVDAEARLETVSRDVQKAEQDLAAAESITPQDIRNLESERDIALGIESDVPFTKVDKGEVDRQVAETVKELESERVRLENDFKLVSKRPLLDRRDLREDLVSSIEEGLGAGKNSKLYNSFIKRWVAPLRASNPQTRRGGDLIPFGYDDVAGMISESFNLSKVGDAVTAEAAWTELARRWARYQQIKKEVAELRRPEARESITKRMQDEADAIVDAERQRASRELDLVDEAGFTRSSEDYNQIIESAKNTDVARLRVETLRRQAQELSDRIQQIGQELAVNRRQLEDAQLQGRQRRLRGVEQRSTKEASQLESTALKGQQAEVKGRLKGVGKVVDGEPQLQRQFAGPIEAEAATIEAKQAKDQRAVQTLRESFARQDEALAATQDIAETPLRADEERARSMVGEGEAPIYIPAGASRLVTPVSQIDMALQTEGIAPETVGSFERMRQGTIIPLTAGQVASRVSEAMNVLTRNIVMQRIISEGGFVSTVAQVIPVERRTAMMEQATQIADRSGRSMNTRQRQTLIEAEYQKLLFDELQKQGLDPISPVAMPDPMDVYAERAALGALDERVDYTQIDDNTMVMPRGMRQGLASQFQAIGTGPQELRGLWGWTSRNTAGWKSMVLPTSFRWQLGDHVSNILNAWVRGDVPPAEIYRLMPEMLRRMQGDNMTRAELMLGEGAEGYLVDPVMQAMETLGLQSSGQRLADLREMRKGTLVSPPTRITGRGFTFPKLRQRSFAFNEFQNRWVRHTLAFKKLQDSLEAQGRSIDEVTPTTVQSDPVLYEAVRDAVESANDALGNFSQLTEFERRYMRSVYPFWAWVKFINKAAGQLLVTQPDRVLFYAHLGSLTLEPEAEGMWEYLRGASNLPLGLTDVGFLNPYSDAILFARNPVSAAVEQFTNLSPVISAPLTAISEGYYGLTGRRAPLLPTLSRPSYLEGRPGETTRSVGDVVGGIGYYGLKTFGGPYRNILDAGVPFTSISGRIPGTDVYYGPGQRFGQGSLRTTGPYAEPRLSRNMMQASALLKTFGIPAPLAESEFAERMAAEGARRGRLSYRRRLSQRREAERRLR